MYGVAGVTGLMRVSRLSAERRVVGRLIPSRRPSVFQSIKLPISADQQISGSGRWRLDRGLYLFGLFLDVLHSHWVYRRPFRPVIPHESHLSSLFQHPRDAHPVPKVSQWVQGLAALRGGLSLFAVPLTVSLPASANSTSPMRTGRMILPSLKARSTSFRTWLAAPVCEEYRRTTAKAFLIALMISSA